MTEKQIEKSIIQYLKLKGFWVEKMQSGHVFVDGSKSGGKSRMINLGGSPGAPDILACINGRFVAIEVKKDEKTTKKWLRYDLSKSQYIKGYDKRLEAQRRHRDQVLSNGGIHIITFSIEDLEGDLKHYNLI